MISASKIVQDASKVGFIGLGNMGRGMAKNLIDKGHDIVAFDTSPEAVKDIVSHGAKEAGSPKDVAGQCSTLVTMLPNNDIVRKVYGDPSDGVLSGLRKGSFLIDSSTIDPAVSKEISEAASKAGARCFVDAPVSGGVNAAAAGTLTFMVGAPSQADFADAKAVLDKMGAKVIHCGDVGTGGAVKICNNMLLAISMIGVSETLNLGVK